MKDQIEEIQKQHLEAIMDNHYLGAFDRNDAAKSCALITKKHMDIARLDDFIQGLKDYLKKGVFPGELKELENQLEQLKNV